MDKDRDDSLEIMRMENEIRLQELELKKAELFRLKKAREKARELQQTKPEESLKKSILTENKLAKVSTKNYRQRDQQNEDSL